VRSSGVGSGPGGGGGGDGGGIPLGRRARGRLLRWASGEWELERDLMTGEGWIGVGFGGSTGGEGSGGGALMGRGAIAFGTNRGIASVCRCSIRGGTDCEGWKGSVGGDIKGSVGWIGGKYSSRSLETSLGRIGMLSLFGSLGAMIESLRDSTGDIGPVRCGEWGVPEIAGENLIASGVLPADSVERRDSPFCSGGGGGAGINRGKGRSGGGTGGGGGRETRRGDCG